jgi:molybdopterin biosynthesis enzyme
MAPSDQQQQGALTSLEDARALLMARLRPAEPMLMALDDAAGRICAEPLAAPAHPPQAYALRRGWAVCADEIVGASNYAPVLPARAPLAVEAGDRLPPGYDCVIEPYGVERIGAMAQVVVEAAPGANVRRPGEDARSPACRG